MVIRFGFMVMALALALGLHAQNQSTEKALEYILNQEGKFKGYALTANDLRVSDVVTDAKSGAQHVYIIQQHNGIDILNAISSIHLNGSGEIYHHNNQFYNPGQRRIGPSGNLSREEAITKTADYFGTPLTGSLIQKEVTTQSNRLARYENSSISKSDIEVYLLYVPKGKDLRLCWNVFTTKVDDHFMWNTHVDTESGEIISKISWTAECSWDIDSEHSHSAMDEHYSEEDNHSLMTDSSYNVWPLPGESPNHIARAIAVEPWLTAPNASPFGWHDTDGAGGTEFTITQGNNVFAYVDRNDDQVPEFSPDGGSSLTFDFPVNLGVEQPVAYQDVATTNLFYWNNIIHDVLYQYGFDESAGNFQFNNYGNGGAGSDEVNAGAQTGADLNPPLYNNATFGTPPDGINPTMRMFEFTSTNPRRDSDLDAGIIAHEYGHGVSNRLTGGPANTGCLNGQEQMGEGWSDYITLMLTVETGDMGADRRGVGTYVLGQATTGDGIRTFPYSTDVAINPHTYDDIMTEAVPHGVGSVWAEMLWEMTWALIDKHGFNPDVYDDWTTGGNNLALQLVIDGMKLQPCAPGFVDGRDAILAADQALTGGDNQCEIWGAFAKRGLGFSAVQGSSGSRSDGVEAFDLPLICLDTLIFEKTAVSATFAGDIVEFTLKVTNLYETALTNVVVTDVLDPGFTYVPNSLTCGSIEGNTITIAQAVLDPDEMIQCSFQATTNPANFSNVYYEDDLESGTGNWTTQNGQGANTWTLSNTNAHSPDNAWFSPNSLDEDNTQYVILNSMALQAGSELSFWHHYNTEPGWDGGIVEISIDGGMNWTDLGPLMIDNGYNSTLGTNNNVDINGRDAFSGNSNGFINTRVDLNSFGTQNVMIRFLFGQDDNTFGVAPPDPGWYVDDVQLVVPFFLDNLACVTTSEGDNLCDSTRTTFVEVSCFDGFLDGDETGIDCGGSCGLCPCTEIDLTKTYTSEVLDGTLDRLKQTIELNNGSSVQDGSVVDLRAGTAINMSGTFTIENNAEAQIIIEDCVELPGGN